MPDLINTVTLPEFTTTIPISSHWIVGIIPSLTNETKFQIGSLSHSLFLDIGNYTHPELDYMVMTLSGDKPEVDSTITIVQTNSAFWAEHATSNPDYAVRSLSSNWEDTYLSYSSISATTNNVNTIVISNSADWANHKDLELRSLSGNFDEWTETYVVVSTTSSDWNNNTSILNLSSILWNDVYNNFNNISSTTIDVSTVVENNSAFWAEHATSNPDYGMRSLSSNWENTYLNVGTNSADWGDHRDFGVRSLTGLWDEWTETYAEVSASSANWNSAYLNLNENSGVWDNIASVVNSNSAAWLVDNDTTQDVAVRLLTAGWEDTRSVTEDTSANWNSNYNTVNTNSAQWAVDTDTIYDDTLLQATSADWNDTRTTVNLNSASWDTHTDVSVLSVAWEETYTTYSSNSSTYSDTRTTVNTNSAQWAVDTDTIYDDTALQAASGGWISNIVEDATPQLAADLDAQGNNITSVNYIDFDSLVVNPSHLEGRLFYDGDIHALSYYNNEAEVTINLGQEVVRQVYNDSGSTITNGSVVFENGNNVGTGLPTIALAQANSTAYVLGVVTHDIENNSVGYVTEIGTVRGLNTTSFNNGDVLYLSDSVAGAYTSTQPIRPSFIIKIGIVSKKAGGTNGSIDVSINQDTTPFTAIDKFWYGGTGGNIIEGDITDSAKLILNGTSEIYTTSADWNSNYNTVQSNSATWGDTATSVPDVAVRNLTAGWTETELAVKSNSAAWSSHTDLTLVQATSSDWNDTRTTVNTNSAQWAVDTDTIYDDTALNATSADWNSNYTTVNSNSASWTAHTDLTLVQNASGGWDVTETVVQSNSAQWAIDTDTVYDDTLLQATSADWNDTRTTVNTNSAQWAVDTDTVYDDTAIQNQLDGVETTVNTNSAQWAIDTDTIYDDTALQAASGGWNNIETTVNTNSAQWAVDTDTIYDDTLLQATSADWNDTRTTVNSNSSQWAVDTDTVYDDTAIQNQLDGVETTVETNSAQWAVDTDTIYDDTLLQATSADWNDTRTTVNTNSATNWLNPTGAQIKSLYEGEANTNAYTNAEQTKVGYISISQNVDLDAIESRVTDLDAAVTLQGTWDASSGSFPSGTTAGHSYIVSVAGTVDSVSFNINDRLISLIDGASTTTYASNWHKADYTDAVLSVAGKIGAVTLDFDDVSETASIKYFTLTLQNNLNSNYTTVNANSAQWAVDTVYDDTAIQAQIDGVETTVNTNSAQWAVDTDTVYDDTALQAASGGWNNIETTVEANSAQWAVDTDTIYDDTAIQNQINGVETTVNTNSAQWAVDTDTVYDDTALQAASGGWNSTETTVNTNSASWAGGGGGDVSAASNITDNAIVRGDGGTKGVQSSNITIDDAGDTITTSANTLNINSALNGNGLFIGNSVSLLSPSNGTFVDVANAGVTLQDESGPIAYLDSVGFGLGPLGSLSGVQVLAILDEDTMVSNSNAALATQQSIKAYVDSNAVTYNDTALQAASGDWNLNYTTVNNNSADWSDTRTTVNSNSASWAGGGGGSGDAVVRNESQTAHGFAVGDLVYDNAGTWTKAQADDPTTAEVVGIVTTANANDFDLTISGYVSGLTGLTANTLYYLSDSVAGSLTTTEPTSNGSVSKPVFWATSTTTGYFINYRGMVVGNVDMLSRNESQTAHGFAVGDVLYDNAGTWTKAQANDPTTADVIGIVAAVDTNSFDLAVSGYVTGLAGFTANTLYYLSDSVAGSLTTTEPTSNGSVSKPVFWATSTTTGYFINYRGVINNANGATTLNQSQTAHGFIVGDVLYDNAGTWTKAQADDPTTADVIGIVTAANTNDFDLTTSGYVSGLTGLTPNTAYYLSDSTAGGLVIISPTASGTVSKPILWATSSTAGYFINYRGIVNKDNGLTVRNESQTAHGFAVGDLLYDNAGTWTKARADAEATSDVIGIVTTVNTNDFDLTVSGYVSGLSGLTANSAYFLSDTTAGALTLTEPTTEGYVSKPVFWATSTTAGYFTNYRGMVIASALAPQAGDILQSVVQEYDPSAAQDLTTTHSDVDGSNYNFTPVSASSNIVYRYNFLLTNVDVAGASHFKLLVDGVLEDESETTIYVDAGNQYAGDIVSFEYLIQSWGTTAKTVKMQGRDYSATNDMKLFETVVYDGGVSAKLRKAVLTITEYAT